MRQKKMDETRKEEGVRGYSVSEERKRCLVKSGRSDMANTTGS